LKRLAHSFGSPNYITESSTCFMAMAMAFKLNYGAIGFPDMGKAKCLLNWSTSPFYSKNPSVPRGLLEAKEKGLKIIDVGPLITPLTAHADIHLRIRPGTSGALALGIANVIIDENIFDREFVENWTVGFEQYRSYAGQFTPQVTEKVTGVPAELIRKAARLYAESKPAALMTSASATLHHTNGTQNERALLALIGLTGNWDIPGGNVVKPDTYIHVPAGVETREAKFVQPRSWSEMAPRLGEKVYPLWKEMVNEAQGMQFPAQMETRKPYPILAMLAFGLNYRMWPGSDFMREALKKLDFFVDVELFMTDTAKLADIVLPACTSFERSELKFYGQGYVIWTQPAIQPLGESRSDAEIIFELAHRLVPEDPLFKKGHEGCVDWIIEPSGLKLEVLKRHPAGMPLKGLPALKFRKYKESGFPTPSGKMEFVSTLLAKHGLDGLPKYNEPKHSPVSTPDLARDFPLVLTTGARLPMFIHSRTFRMPWTKGLRPDPVVDINPADAEKRGLSQGEWVTLSTPRSSARVRANVTVVVPPGVANIYHGYPDVEVNQLIEPDYLDPISGFPGFKSLLCEVKKNP
ncbi:MAG: molybdopterin-dependent oxidoreductase, partial [Pseudomonadota bacterium]